ncbi:oxidoreductase [Nocardioides marinquilinus]|uniref:WD40/YVTN/BNR-like repeat-containing protein n=1 Tax=Nocardioides marinquilinus TaxID=1210400 RepID=UPI0031E6F225
MAAALGTLIVSGLPGASATPSSPAPAPDPRPDRSWQQVEPFTDQGLRGLAVAGPNRVWVAGDDGGVFRTGDGGRRWVDVSPETDTPLAFRDVEVVAPGVAVVMSIGTGTDSRIYRTTDAGRSWREVFRNRDPQAFYDCVSMWPDGRHGIAFSDPVDGRFRIIRTADAGRTWRVVKPRRMPRALEGEFAFAASGTCIETAGRTRAWFGTGGADARVFRTTDRGRTWRVSRVPIRAGESSGVNSIEFRGPRVGVAVGGDFAAPGRGRRTVAVTTDGGLTWQRGADARGYRSAVAFRRPSSTSVVVAVGSGGSDLSPDAGRHWRPVGDLSLDAVRCVSGTCWGSGQDGVVARLRLGGSR